MARLRSVSFWFGSPELTDSNYYGLLSAASCFDESVLYVYEPVANVPKGVATLNAATLLSVADKDLLLSYGVPTAHVSDIVRMRAASLLTGCGVNVVNDVDMLWLRRPCGDEFVASLFAKHSGGMTRHDTEEMAAFAKSEWDGHGLINTPLGVSPGSALAKGLLAMVEAFITTTHAAKTFDSSQWNVLMHGIRNLLVRDRLGGLVRPPIEYGAALCWSAQTGCIVKDGYYDVGGESAPKDHKVHGVSLPTSAQILAHAIGLPTSFCLAERHEHPPNSRPVLAATDLLGFAEAFPSTLLSRVVYALQADGVFGRCGAGAGTAMLQVNGPTASELHAARNTAQLDALRKRLLLDLERLAVSPGDVLQSWTDAAATATKMPSLAQLRASASTRTASSWMAAGYEISQDVYDECLRHGTLYVVSEARNAELERGLERVADAVRAHDSWKLGSIEPDWVAAGYTRAALVEQLGFQEHKSPEVPAIACVADSRGEVEVLLVYVPLREEVADMQSLVANSFAADDTEAKTRRRGEYLVNERGDKPMTGDMYMYGCHSPIACRGPRPPNPSSPQLRTLRVAPPPPRRCGELSTSGTPTAAPPLPSARHRKHAVIPTVKHQKCLPGEYSPRERGDPDLQPLLASHVKSLIALQERHTPASAELREHLVSSSDPGTAWRIAPNVAAFSCSLARCYVVVPHRDAGAAHELILFSFDTRASPSEGHCHWFVCAGRIYTLPSAPGSTNALFSVAPGVMHGTGPSSDTLPTASAGLVGSALVTKTDMLAALRTAAQRAENARRVAARRTASSTNAGGSSSGSSGGSSAAGHIGSGGGGLSERHASQEAGMAGPAGPAASTGAAAPAGPARESTGRSRKQVVPFTVTEGGTGAGSSKAAGKRRRLMAAVGGQPACNFVEMVAGHAPTAQQRVLAASGSTFAQRMRPLLQRLANGETPEPDGLKWDHFRDAAVLKVAAALGVRRIPNGAALVACTAETIAKMGCKGERHEVVGRLLGGVHLWTEFFSSTTDCLTVHVNASDRSVKVTYLSASGRKARARACAEVDAQTLMSSRRCSTCGALAREVCSVCDHQPS